MSAPQSLEQQAPSGRYGTTSGNTPNCEVAYREPFGPSSGVRYRTVYGTLPIPDRGRGSGEFAAGLSEPRLRANRGSTNYLFLSFG